jgi:hypothetical protein
MKNTGGRPAGSITAAMFLQEFAGEKLPGYTSILQGLIFQKKRKAI